MAWAISRLTAHPVIVYQRDAIPRMRPAIDSTRKRREWVRRPTSADPIAMIERTALATKEPPLNTNAGIAKTPERAESPARTASLDTLPPFRRSGGDLTTSSGLAADAYEAGSSVIVPSPRRL